MCCAICSQRITGHYGTALGAGVHLELMGCVEALTQRAEAAEAAEKQFADAAQRWEDAYYAERAERDALRKDAARLDWLEKAANCAIEVESFIGADNEKNAVFLEWAWDDIPPDFVRSVPKRISQGRSLRAALDAALAVQP